MQLAPPFRHLGVKLGDAIDDGHPISSCGERGRRAKLAYIQGARKPASGCACSRKTRRTPLASRAATEKAPSVRTSVATPAVSIMRRAASSRRTAMVQAATEGEAGA